MSDTHDNAENIEKAVEIFNEHKVQVVFHLGDWASPTGADFYNKLEKDFKTISVFGNNDGDKYRFLIWKKRIIGILNFT